MASNALDNLSGRDDDFSHKAEGLKGIENDSKRVKRASVPNRILSTFKCMENGLKDRVSKAWRRTSKEKMVVLVYSFSPLMPFSLPLMST